MKMLTALLLGGSLMVAGTASAAPPPCELDGTPVPGSETKSISPAHFKTLHAKMAPSGEGERWATIPWQVDLAAARQKAAQEGKPLFMWVMDGHPLGCT